MHAPEAADGRDDIARRLDAMREAHQWSLSELAHRAGLKLGVLSAIHTGARKGRNMKLGTALQLCAALGAKVGRDLLGEEELPPPLPAGVDLAQMSQAEKDTLLIRLIAEVLQRGLQLPAMLGQRSDYDAAPSC